MTNSQSRLLCSVASGVNYYGGGKTRSMKCTEREGGKGGERERKDF